MPPFEVLIGRVVCGRVYDITSTYFEGLAEGNALAEYRYSRDHRPDCKQVCIALVVTREGLPLDYEVFPGSRR